MSTEQVITIEEELKQSLKKASGKKIEAWRDKAIEDTKCLEGILSIAMTTEKPYCWRCGWIISKIAYIRPNVIEPHIDVLINYLDKIQHHSHKAGIMGAILFVNKINEEHFGFLADYCIQQISMLGLASHVKYCAMKILQIIADAYPELAREFALVVEDNLPYFEKAYLKKLGKEFVGTMAKLA